MAEKDKDTDADAEATSKADDTPAAPKPAGGKKKSTYSETSKGQDYASVMNEAVDDLKKFVGSSPVWSRVVNGAGKVLNGAEWVGGKALDGAEWVGDKAAAGFKGLKQALGSEKSPEGSERSAPQGDRPGNLDGVRSKMTTPPDTPGGPGVSLSTQESGALASRAAGSVAGPSLGKAEEDDADMTRKLR